MTKKDQMYGCKVCGNVVVIVKAGPGNLICCAKPMFLLKEEEMAEFKK